MKEITLYRDGNEWSTWLSEDGRAVYSEWGKVGGLFQQTCDVPKPRGKEGTAAWKSTEQVALEEYARGLKKKRDEGYRATTEPVVDRDIFEKLDKHFVPSKPIKEMSDKELRHWDTQGMFIIQRKRDGERHFILIRTDDCRIYSRRVDDVTDKFPALVATIMRMGLPPGTILDGEIIVDRDGVDEFRSVASVTRSLPARAAKMEASLPVKFMLFDVLFSAYESTYTRPYYARLNLVKDYVVRDQYHRVIMPAIVFASFDVACEMCIREKWEGLVLWYKDSATIVRIGGQPKRTGCVKWKPIKENDFIATGYYFGTGRNSDVAGGIKLALLLPNGKYLDCGKCGTGFDDDTRDAVLYWKFPCVVQVEYDSVGDKGKLRFPAFKRKRDDLDVADCKVEELLVGQAGLF